MSVDLGQFYDAPLYEVIRLKGGPCDRREVRMPDRRGGLVRMPLPADLSASLLLSEPSRPAPRVAQYRERLGPLGPSRADDGALIFDFYQYE